MLLAVGIQVTVNNSYAQSVRPAAAPEPNATGKRSKSQNWFQTSFEFKSQLGLLNS
jgi:hypothetical protein